MHYSDRIAIVLVEPQNPGNVGMVCRAMKNFGLTDLRLVNPCSLEHPEASKFAVFAKDMLNSVRRFTSLADAISDSPLSVATTRRHGKYRNEIRAPHEIVELIAENLAANRAALVFGREDSGLTTDELALCRWQATIPTAGEHGSLNLAQSVIIFCYELSQRFIDVDRPENRELAATEEMEPLFTQMEPVLMKIGFLKPENPAHMMRSFRRILARASLDRREVAVLRGMFSQIDWATDEFRGKKKR